VSFSELVGPTPPFWPSNGNRGWPKKNYPLYKGAAPGQSSEKTTTIHRQLPGPDHLNILTLTSTAFNAAISGLMGTALGIRTVSSALQNKIASQDKAIKKHKATSLNRKVATKNFGARLASRTKRVAAKSITAIPAESIPFIGVTVLIADTDYELYAACEAVKDLDQTVRWRSRWVYGQFTGYSTYSAKQGT
jgi:hypothetical protein